MVSISTLRLNWDRFSEHDNIISWLKAPPRLLVAINESTLQYSRHKHGLALTVPFGVRHHYFPSYARSLYKYFLIRDCSVWMTTFIHGQWYRLLHHPFDICACQMRFILIRRGQHESWPVAIDDINKKPQIGSHDTALNVTVAPRERGELAVKRSWPVLTHK